jgi:hypothetical protein
MIEYLPLILTGVGLTASIIYYATIIQNANKARQRELIYQRIPTINADFYNNWRRLFTAKWQTYQEFQEYISENPREYGYFAFITITLNSVGLLLKENVIDPERIFSVYTPNMTITTWNRSYPVIKVWREGYGYSELYSGLEYLYNEARKRYPDMRWGKEYWDKVYDLTGYRMNWSMYDSES